MGGYVCKFSTKVSSEKSLHAGGLAAPALAAVAGTVMTGVGVGGAAAGITTGVVGSSVGMAAAFGAVGASAVGDRMARRLGELPCAFFVGLLMPLQQLWPSSASSLPAVWEASLECSAHSAHDLHEFVQEMSRSSASGRSAIRKRLQMKMMWPCNLCQCRRQSLWQTPD